MSSFRYQKDLIRNVGGIVALGLGGLLLNSSFYTVEGGHRAIIFSWFSGVKSMIYTEGTHLLIPFIERAIIYDVRSKPKLVTSLTGTKDLQMVNITLRVLFKPDVSKLPIVYQRLGKDYDERVLPSIVNEVLKSVVAQFNASQLVTQREKVSRLIRQRLVDRAKNFNIILDDVSITGVQFGDEFTKAVEAKQIAQQDAQRAAYMVQKAEQDSQAIVMKADGEAQSAMLIGEAISRNPAFIELRKIEAAREIASNITKGNNKLLLNAKDILLSLGD